MQCPHENRQAVHPRSAGATGAGAARLAAGGPLALCISAVVAHALDLTPIPATYATGDGRGQPPYHPALMVKLRVYASGTGTPSARQIEPATYAEVPSRVLAATPHPDPDGLAAFRQQHLQARAGLPPQVLALCRTASLVQLGHVALDGTKVLANASTHKAMRASRMGEAERKREQEVATLLRERRAPPLRRMDPSPAAAWDEKPSSLRRLSP